LQTVRENKEHAKEINKYIEEVRFKLMECHKQLQLENKVLNVVAIKSLFLGEEKKENTLGVLMEYHNMNMKSILQPGTLKKLSHYRKIYKMFLRHKYNRADAGQTHENDKLKKIKVFSVPVAHLVGRT
jgi:hypothetical protein